MTGFAFGVCIVGLVAAIGGAHVLVLGRPSGRPVAAFLLLGSVLLIAAGWFLLLVTS